MATGTFGTAINCMDGRAQQPIIDWMTKKFNVDYVDMITEPGPDKIVSAGTPDQLASVLNRVKISTEKHGSEVIVITGHDDCAGNPVSKEQHITDVKNAMQVIKGWNLPAAIYGLWINTDWQVEVIDVIEK
jgi:hypothetical protein